METNNSAPSSIEELSPELVDHVVSTWVDILKTPIPAGGHILEDDNFLNISTTWTVNDPSKKETVRFQKNFSLLKTSLSWDKGETCIENENLIMNETAATPIDGKLVCVSRHGSRKAILVEKNSNFGSGPEQKQKDQFIQVWDENTLLKSYNLSELDKHKSVYTGADFGTTMVWNGAGDKLAYLAEKKVPKPRPFFSSDVPRDENSNCSDAEKTKDAKDPRGEEYALKQSWGEQMSDMHFSVIAVLDLTSDKFNVIELPADWFPMDIQWIDDSIAGTSYKIQDWRLGLIYCTNRESRIFRINADGTSFQFLSATGEAAFCPRVRPDGQQIIWQQRAVDAPHDRARNIMSISIKDKAAVPTCIYESVPTNLPIYVGFPKHCWSPDSTSFFVIAVNDGVHVLMAIMLPKDGKVETRFIFETSPGIDNILWIGEKYMLLSRSSTLSFPHIELMEIFGGNRRAAITKSRSSVPNASYSIQKLFGQASIPSFYVGPEGCKPKSVPLIVWAHGGPHSYFADSYVHESTLLARLGYAFLKVNYIGSTGASKRDETDDLLGKIGTLDVQDSQNIVEKAIQNFASIDPQRVGVWGGSHGGFITCHLISQFPDFYQAAVARNPVIDLNVMIGISDITDWCYAETGLPFLRNLQTLVPAAKSPEETEKLFKVSPISHVSKVKAATLLCVGTQDLRVPPTQGLSFYRALKAYGKTAEVRVYPDCHPLSTVPVRMDNVIHSALWFKRFIK